MLLSVNRFDSIFTFLLFTAGPSQLAAVQARMQRGWRQIVAVTGGDENGSSTGSVNREVETGRHGWGWK